jgi:microsomal dipeptidase-like Zn-dependent dipeptidase/gamma-glutamyl-gamma-aminobutyrate hydrolase PuuD
MPVIGITSNFGEKGSQLAKAYYDCVLRAGGVPLIIPPYQQREALMQTLSLLDGILLSGGGDIDPVLLGEEPAPNLSGICIDRDILELDLIREAERRQVPMLGICRGEQMIAIALGGTLYQDLPSQYKAEEGVETTSALLHHSQEEARDVTTHEVKIAEGSLLESVMGKCEALAVNSFHHQAVKDCGRHLKVVARSSDGVVEAVESAECKSIIGVQWHPECLAGGEEGERHRALFAWLVERAAEFKAAKAFHAKHLTLDSHCDTPMVGVSEFAHRSEKALVDVVKMEEGRLDASIMVAYLPQGDLTDEARARATAQADEILTGIKTMVRGNAGRVAIAETPDDLYRIKESGRKAIMTGIENGYAIGRDLSLLQHFKEEGIVYMTLCHNGDNDICDSARLKGADEHLHGGVSAFGRDVIREMNRRGVMVDMSHAHERSFYDALEISERPIVCSHSSARALCDHPRNLTDEQMRALAKKGGVAQVTFYEGFLRKDGGATIEDAVAHLNHMVKVMGVEHVGVGTDFDGDGGVPGVASASDIINFTCRLLRERYSEADLRLLWGENFLRVMREVQRGTR